MVDQVHVATKAGILVIEIVGTLTPDHARQVIEKTRAGTPDEALPRLWDLREAVGDLDRAELRRIADLAQREEHAPARIAMLVSTDLIFGQTRIVGVYRETAPPEVEVFREEAAALRWLRGGRA
jgi:hypothetical protein